MIFQEGWEWTRTRCVCESTHPHWSLQTRHSEALIIFLVNTAFLKASWNILAALAKFFNHNWVEPKPKKISSDNGFSFFHFHKLQSIKYAFTENENKVHSGNHVVDRHGALCSPASPPGLGEQGMECGLQEQPFRMDDLTFYTAFLLRELWISWACNELRRTLELGPIWPYSLGGYLLQLPKGNMGYLSKLV